MNKEKVLDEINPAITPKGNKWIWAFLSILILASFFSIHTFCSQGYSSLNRFRVLDLYQTFTNFFFALSITITLYIFLKKINPRSIK
ncbi:MAG: hypothetical protein AAF573_19900, partial [Bacteroidota bacterium]